ncbi:MAG: glycosyltransferase [Bacteroidia bacterium]|nr:glycosyltransferase [Bacteroidia bacterium]MCF8427072.1 glycosyltransferase [Bacteroidia bacterium]MCF8446894.1 glycosyltransferase [Bacteroidia bacterium]
MKDLDLVIPVYNSTASIKQLISSINQLAQSAYFNLHVIFVNDGSQDKTHETLLDSLGIANFKITYIRLAKNYGQHSATATGFFHSKAEFIATMDDDLQHNPIELIQLHKKMLEENADLVYGTFEEKKHSFFRNSGTKILQLILGSESKKYKLVTSFRLMKKEAVVAFKSKQSKFHFIDDYLIHSSSIVCSNKVSHHSRLFGKSGYSGVSLFSLAYTILFLHSSLPLKFISRLGVFLSIAFFAIGCYYIFQKLFYDVAIGFTSLIVAIFFSTGLIMFSLGVIGEYIRQIWVSNQELDKVIVAEICKN